MTPRFVPATRPREKQSITAVLLGQLTELRVHRRSKQAGGSFPCLGKRCEYARQDVCTAEGFYRWHGCALSLKHNSRPATPDEWQEKVRQFHAANPQCRHIKDPAISHEVSYWTNDRLYIAELYDSELAVLNLGDDHRGVVLCWSYPPRTVRLVNCDGQFRGTVPDPFDLDTALERLYGMPIRVPEEPAEQEEEARIIKFKRKLA